MATKVDFEEEKTTAIKLDAKELQHIYSLVFAVPVAGEGMITGASILQKLQKAAGEIGCELEKPQMRQNEPQAPRR